MSNFDIFRRIDIINHKSFQKNFVKFNRRKNGKIISEIHTQGGKIIASKN